MNLMENGRKLSKSVEKTAGKGEIARYEQFLFFPQCFQKDLYCTDVKTRACLGKGYARAAVCLEGESVMNEPTNNKFGAPDIGKPS